VFVKFNTYTVKSGENLAAIARRFKVKSTDLALANRLSPSAKLQAGQTLMIPRDPGAAAALTTRPSAPAPAPSSSASAKTTKPAPAAKAAPTAPTTYRVKSGDTLTSIARQFATTVTDLKRLNQLSSDDLSIGEKLTIRR
jgi:membrane-bound lytic murein transglycosylase D